MESACYSVDELEGKKDYPLNLDFTSVEQLPETPALNQRDFNWQNSWS